MDVGAVKGGQETKYVIPTLYIGLGGTGLEVLMRLRRRMLTAAWGPRGQRLNSLDDFPAAEFLYYDLDCYHEIFSPADPLAELIRIQQQDCLNWDLLGFGVNRDTILRSPHIASWFPEDERDRRFNNSIRPSRYVPRLHFFVHYSKIRAAISRKLSSLREASCHQERLSRLGLEAVADQVRVVVLCSFAGGTGSGTFLDMGWLARFLADRDFPSHSQADLCLFIPSSDDSPNNPFRRAFGYAAFMELETAMRGMTGHMSAWDPNEGMPDLPPTPYTGVFLLENANLVGQSAYSFEAAWDMAAAALFEEISGGTLAERMHRIRVIKEFETFSPFYPLLPSDFDGVKLAFSKGYSSFGHSELTAKNQAGSASGRDPLLTELLEKPPAERQELIMRLFREAMPWIDADLSGLGVRAEQFTCLLGVADVREWDVLREELVACLPKGMSPDTMRIVSTGELGRAVCHVELTGIPLCALKGLESWRTSYRTEGRKGEVLHTHIDPTLFQHPVVPSTEECKRLAADLRLFLLAVMLRKMERNSRKTTPSGLYQFDFGLGDWRSLGNERAFRMDGLPPVYRTYVEDAVNKTLDELNCLQLQALAYIAEYFQRETYFPATHITERGEVAYRPGLMHLVAKKLCAELGKMAHNRGLSVEGATLLESRLADWGEDWADVTDSFARWTEIVPESNLDATPWEVKPPEPNGPDRCKRRVQLNFFKPGWLQELVGSVDGGGGGFQPLNGPWWFGIDGQKVGPCDDKRVRELIDEGTVDEATLAWRKGMDGWRPAGEVPELEWRFFGPPPLDEEGPPPLG